MKTASEVLMEAKWKVLDRGWMQLTSCYSSGVCAGIAIAECYPVGTVGSSLDGTRPFDYFMKAVGITPPLGGDINPLYRWNDAPGREEAEVLEAFDEAIRLAKEDESRHAPSTTYQDNSLKVGV